MSDTYWRPKVRKCYLKSSIISLPLPFEKIVPFRRNVSVCHDLNQPQDPKSRLKKTWLSMKNTNMTRFPACSTLLVFKLHFFLPTKLRSLKLYTLVKVLFCSLKLNFPKDILEKNKGNSLKCYQMITSQMMKSSHDKHLLTLR